MKCYIDGFEEVVTNIRKQKYESAVVQYSSLFDNLKEEPLFVDSCSREGENIINSVSSLYDALVNDDLVLLADVIEETLIPWLKSKLDYADTRTYGDYQLEPTSSGAITIKYLPLNIYLHSNVNPYREGRELIDYCVTGEKNRYAIWGLGWGYHILPIVYNSQGAARIVVFESDKNLIDLFCNEADIYDEIKESIVIEHDPIGSKFASFLENNDAEIVMHYPSVKKITTTDVKRSIKRFYAVWNGINEMSNIINANITYNLDNTRHVADELEECIRGKKVIVIGAGPSVDDGIDVLKEYSSKNDIVMIAATSIAEVLIKNEVYPDYLCAIDPTKQSYLPIKDLNHSIPYIISPSAYWEIVKNSKSDCYVGLIKDNTRSEQVAKMRGCKTFLTGGTVISLAVDIACKLGACKIGLIGVDLAYRNGNSHAKDAYENTTTDERELIPVEGIDGELVYTSESLLSYRKWLEREIAANSKVPFYNFSQTGARILGTRDRDGFDD